MPVGVVGRKVGMMRIFTDNGMSIPVSVIYVEPNRVTQIKTVNSDGYDAVQLTVGSVKKKRMTKAAVGHFAKVNVEPGRGLWEFRVNKNDDTFTSGQVLTIACFSVGDLVDATSATIGKGFAGVVKRHNFSTQDATHGNSLSHRVHGSTGQNQSPGRVFKGKRMAGQMGNRFRTIQNLEIMRVDIERHLLLIKGAVAGARGSDVVIRSAVKAIPSKR